MTKTSAIEPQNSKAEVFYKTINFKRLAPLSGD
jgi:hypothetical protein